MDRETYGALIDTERRRFLAACWERGEAPSDEAWSAHLRRVGRVYIHAAHMLLRHAADWEEDPIEAEEEASDEIIALVNTYMRIWPCPHLPPETWEAYLEGDGSFGDDEFDAAFRSRYRELETMPYADYLATPEWADVRRGALRRAGHRCQACGRGRALHVHHRTYDRRGRERPDDLLVLCHECHLAVHVRGGSHRIPVQ